METIGRYEMERCLTYALACDRYRRGVAEFRAARAQLAALDRLWNFPGFGEAPELEMLRHREADQTGSLEADIREAMATVGTRFRGLSGRRLAATINQEETEAMR